MLFGAVGKSLVHEVQKIFPQEVGRERWKHGLRMKTSQVLIFLDDFENKKAKTEQTFWVSEDGSQGIFWTGEIYNWDVLKKRSAEHSLSRELWRSYKRSGLEFLEMLNGAFSLALWDKDENTLLLSRDKMGALQTYYGIQEHGIVFGSDLFTVARVLGKEKEIDVSVMMKYLAFCYNPGCDTFFTGIQRLRPAHFLKWTTANVAIRPYWALPFDHKVQQAEDVLGAEIRERLARAVHIRMEKRAKTGVFLSGGLDSSSVVSLLHGAGKEKLHTFSFRCQGESFDESSYAKIVADTFGADHRVVEYAPEDVFLAQNMVSLMDEPFCDAGINIGTYLLARAAEGKVDELFTGDGGDELFAGHPVYVADKTARLLHWIPRPILTPFFSLGRALPDSEKKNDWKVKVKRFSESHAYPEALGTHRWRVYYCPDELRRLVRRELWERCDLESVYDDVIAFNREARHVDALSQSLYSDYQTVVQFYLRRIHMVRSFGIRPKLPMLDPNVVAYCAAIPSEWKIRGFSDGKYIERVAVDPILPHEIVHRKDKLGHSIPMKNWMRENPTVQQFVFDLLSEETIEKRGLFETDYVLKMKKEHLDRSRNHSHRLWALVILELWMRSVDL